MLGLSVSQCKEQVGARPGGRYDIRLSRVIMILMQFRIYVYIILLNYIRFVRNLHSVIKPVTVPVTGVLHCDL